MNETQKFYGMDISNLRCYFDTDFAYVEEFDTEDGSHWIGKAYPKDWTEEIFERAKRCGYINRCLEIFQRQF